MVRVALPDANLSSETEWPLSDETYGYLIRVHRMSEGDLVVVFDGQGLEVNARLQSEDNRWHLCAEGDVREGQRGHPLTLVYALPKGEKLDLVIRQATELGVGRVILLSSQRSVVKLNSKRAEKRRTRLERIISEAARQSGRSDTMALEGPMDLDEALNQTASVAHRLVLHPVDGHDFESLSLEWPVAIFVGAEGGFSTEELEKLSENQCTRITMQCPVLRTETAATVACALTLHRLAAL